MMRSFTLILFTFLFLQSNSQVEELNPVLYEAMDLTAKGRDSIKKVAAQYNTAKKKISKNIPISSKEKTLVDEIESLENPAFEMFIEEGVFYYVGPGPGCSYEENGGPDSIWSTSILDDKYIVDNIYDGSLDLAWAEGKSDDGIGESINFKMIGNAWPLEKIIVYNGYQKDLSLWKKNNRVKQLLLYIDQQPVAKLNLEDVTNGQEFDVAKWFPQREKPYVLRFEILKTYKGTVYNDTVVSEIDFEGPVRH